MKIVDAVLTKNDCYKTGKKIQVQGLMLHSVGCAQPSAQVFINNWNKAGVEKCVHAFIDANDGTVYQTLPWNYRGWHAGGAANNTHIGVEMCEPKGIKYTGGATFIVTNESEAEKSAIIAYYAAVELFGHLCKEYNLNPMTQIISHSEGYKMGIATNHGDPVHLWNQLKLGLTMDGFRKDVQNEIKEQESIKPGNRYHKIEDIPPWAQEPIKFYINIGALQGNNGDLDLSYDMVRMLVIQHRAFFDVD